MTKILLRSTAFAALLALAATPARAEFAYAVTLLDNQLISVDTTTGAGTLVAPLSMPISPSGLASVNNQLYTFDSGADAIRQINTTTGGIAASYNLSGIGATFGQGGLAFQTATTGFLTTALDGNPNSPTYLSPVNGLYSFNLATGSATLVANTATTLESIAFGPNGTLYGLGKLDGTLSGTNAGVTTDNLYTIDPTTGATTLIGNVGIPVGSPVGALSFDPSGALFATLDDTLYQLNTATGIASAVNPDPTAATGFFSISGLAFASPTAAVPEPSSVVLLGLGIALTCGSFARKRRAAGRAS